MKFIAWCITGGGANLREIAKSMAKIKSIYNIKITVFMTRWGYEVSRIFGVLPIVRSIASGKYYEEFLVESEGMYYIGRLNLKRYTALVIAPATANTIAKIVNGIADNIASALYAQAIKGGVDVYILPTDIPSESGYIITETPCHVDRDVCKTYNCTKCLTEDICPVNAITIIEGFPRIDLSKCIGCERCMYACPFKAVKCWEKIYLEPRDIDLRNIDILKKQKYTYVASNVNELIEKIREAIENE